MAKVITTELQHSGASGANVTLDSSKNVTCENNLQVDGNVTVTGTLPADKLTGALPAISGASLTGVTDTLSFRRLNINGSMQVAQRATSTATLDGTEGVRALDRWYILYSNSASGACTLSQDTDVPTDYTWGRFANSQKVDVTTANASPSANHGITLQYRFEGQDIANSGWDYTNTNSKLSVSFWAKSVKAGTYCVFLYTQDGTSKIIRTEYTLVANTWKHIELQFAGDSGISFDDDNMGSLYVGWTLLVGSDRDDGVNATWEAGSGGDYGTANQVNFFDDTANNFWLTGVQIEAGDSATDFEHRPYQDELFACLRYCYNAKGTSNTTPPGNAGWYSGSDAHFNFRFPRAMRDSPSFTPSGSWRMNCPGGNGSNQTGDLTFSQNSTNHDGGTFVLASVSSASDAGMGAYLQYREACNFIFDAEL